MAKRKIPTILGILFLVGGLSAGVFLTQRAQILQIGASPEIVPREVRITNVTGDAFTISWATDSPTVGFVNWGQANSLGQTQLSDDALEKSVHSITIRGLTPSTEYFFKINSEGEEFDNSGIAWVVVTGPALATQGVTRTISGSVLTATGGPGANAIVYVTAAGASPQSTVTSTNGNWIMPLSQARDTSLTTHAQFTNTSPLLEIFVQGGVMGVASAQIFPGAAQSTPPIVLGQTHDFRQETSREDSTLPEASVALPDEKTSSLPGFDISSEASTPSAQVVTLESLDEGEVITTAEPEFFGKAPAATKITVTIESETITDSFTVPSSGNWSWTPPEGLEEGVHKITLSWRDESGILRTLIRNFVVQAAEAEPSFESTPSATSTSTPTPTPSPTASPTATPTASPRVSIPSTESGIPNAGTLTPTIALSIMGMGLVAASFYIWKYA